MPRLIETVRLKDADVQAVDIEDDKHEKIEVKAEDRAVQIGNGGARHFMKPKETRYTDNVVKTSKYNIVSFLPVNLWEQFHNVSNVYFLLIGVLQLIPQTSTTNGVPSMWFTLSFILIVSAVRAALEDIAKHKADDLRNKSKYLVLNAAGHFEERASGKLQVGNVIKVLQNQMIPTDCLFLASALAKGHCFIDKANLNGETTLEVLNAFNSSRRFFEDGADMSKFQAELWYEQPNKRFDSFRGAIKLEGSDAAESVDGKVLLMRETNLRNCEFVIGLVVYTGNQTKIQVSNLSGEKAKVKESHIMRLVNKFLLGMFVVQLTMCFIAGLITWVFIADQESNSPSTWYLGLELDDESAADYGFFAIFSWMILLSQMVPISLVVSAEIVKFLQSKFIQWDIHMYYDPIDKPAKCNRSTVHEDLGLIDYVFSDKTGTLTQNKMQFRYALMCDANDYGSTETEIARSVALRNKELRRRQEEGAAYMPEPRKPWTDIVAALDVEPAHREPTCLEKLACCKKIWYDPADAESEQSNNDDAIVNEFTQQERREMLAALYGAPKEGESQEECTARQARVARYLLHMCISSTVKPFEETNKVTGIKELKYQSESAEELAMVLWARDMGYTLVKRGPTTVEVQKYACEQGKEPVLLADKETLVFRHLCTAGFSSARARVTIVYQEVGTKDEKIVFMTKGQDTTVLPLLVPSDDVEYNRDQLELKLNNLCTMGLRTLVAAHAEQPADFWNRERREDWAKVLAADPTPKSEGHKTKKCALLEGGCEKCFEENFFETLETDAQLHYMGCIGMEDQLQLLVPDTIRDCLHAGIKVWMITGDKLETAKNIGLACNLIDADMQPDLHADMTVEQCVKALRNARLIEITGQWASLAKDRGEMMHLFQTFDRNQDGKMDEAELNTCLQTLQFAGERDSVHKLFKELDADADGFITADEFVELMVQCQPTPFEAVLFDINQGMETYRNIVDHEAYPVSILVNRTAFQVMFPGAAKGAKNADGVKKGKVAAAGAPTPDEQEALVAKFFSLASESKSVVFARAEPAMKKRMVTEIMARNPNKIALAIGDGANDTDMIMAAHVGVGIAGVEGTAAVNSADYAIGTFRMLHDLLFVHGFWNYHRVGVLVNFIFYKAVLLATSAYWWGFWSGFGGQQFYNDPGLQLYNVVFTALPIMALSVMNQVVDRTILSNNPTAYKNAKGKAFGPLIYAGWISRSILHGLFIFFMVMSSMRHGVTTDDGRASAGELWYFSTTMFYCVVLLPTTLIMFEFSNINAVSVFALFSSWGSVIVFMAIISELLFVNYDLYKIIAHLYADGMFYLLVIFVVVSILMVELGYRQVKKHFRPSLNQILREKQLLEKVGDKAAGVRHSRGTGLLLSAEDESKWVARKKPSMRASSRTEMMDMKSAKGDTEGRTLKGALIRSMLRFRNLTGASFDSAAQAKYQKHDSPAGGGETQQEEHKHE